MKESTNFPLVAEVAIQYLPKKPIKNLFKISSSKIRADFLRSTWNQNTLELLE